MGEVGSDAWGVDDIVQAELLRDIRAEGCLLYLLGYLGDEGVGLEQQGEWLTDSA